MSGRRSPSEGAAHDGRPPWKDLPPPSSPDEEENSPATSRRSVSVTPQTKVSASEPKPSTLPPSTPSSSRTGPGQTSGPLARKQSLSPQSMHDKDVCILARLVDVNAFSPDLLRAIGCYLNDREKTLCAPTTPTPEEAEAMKAAASLAIPTMNANQTAAILSPLTLSLRRKREEDSSPPSTTEEAKRLCATASPPAWDPLPQHTSSSYADAAATARPADAPTAQINTAAITAPTKRYPPLVVETLPNWPSHFKTLKERLGHNPNARPFGKGVRFSPTTESEYRTIQAYLSELEKTENLVWFSYSLPEDRSIKVAIRGLPAETPSKDIADAFEALGYEPEAIRTIRASKGRPGCIFFAQFRNTPNILNTIYNITELLCMPGVKIDVWRGKKGPAQCHRCQGFRHSSHNCHRPLACVRCGGPHYAGECPRDRASPATCANCGGPHAANSSTCQSFKREARNKRAGAIAITTNSRDRSRSGTRPPPPTTTIPAEASGQSLMAPANQPTERTSRIPKKRKPKRRVVVLDPLLNATSLEHQTTLPASTASRTPSALRSTTPATSQPRSDVPHTRRTALEVRPPIPKPRQASADSARLQVLDTALQILQEVLQALRMGEDPIPLVLSGIGKLVQAGQ